MSAVWGINPDGGIVREHELEALDAAGDDLASYELFFEDASGLYHADDDGDFTPVNPADLLTHLDEDNQQLFHAFHGGNSSFPDAADQLEAYLGQMAERHGLEQQQIAEIAAEVRYDEWSMARLEEAAVHESIDLPKTFEDAYTQAKAENLLPGRKPLPRTPPAARTSMTDAMDSFVSEISDRNAVQQEARNALRAARRAQVEESS